MTLPWRISFRVLPALVALAVPVGAAMVAGTVRVTPKESAHGRNVPSNAGVAVWLEAADRQAHRPVPGVARMAQQRKQFIPHLLAIPVGTTVEFPNLDPIFHNAFSNIDGQPFDTSLYPPGGTRQVLFRRAGIVRLCCNIHQSMSTVIFVAPTPWITISDQSGAFSLEGVAAGQYTLHVFHERATQQTLDALTRKIEIREGPVTLPAIQISETGYIEMPHKNKYGQDYGPVPEDGSSYRKTK